ncbi:unnamed protein product [Urochloa decumbens]|uniref:Agenet domain-containing protein n=1 Tax=Urochloa decumbens TaxID=240449 RepID=A0ABC8Z7E0_9POAL
MVRSPKEEEEERDGEEAAGAGCRGRPRCAAGEEVEVLLNEDGFRGARFAATVAARRPGSGDYEVVFSTLVSRRGGPLLRQDVAAADVRPVPPPPPPGRGIEMFDLVEAYHKDGWWPGVVSGFLRKWRGQARYAVSLPRFREVLELRASLVRPRREFVCGRWIDAQDVLRGIPLYAEGSSVEVLCEKKKGTAWMPATIIKMVGGVNYVVRYGNRKDSIEVLHSCFIRPQPIFDKTKFEYELEPSKEVEVYHDGIWSRGVIKDVCIHEPRRYKVRVKHHGSTDDDYFLVSSTSLRPYSKGDNQEWRPCSTKKHAAERNDSVAEYSSEFSTSDGGSDRCSSDYSPSTSAESSDQYSSDYSLEAFTSDRDIGPYSYVPNKRVWKENVVKEELPLMHSLNLRQHTAKSSPKDVMDMETIPEKEATGVKQLESERKCLGFRVAKENGQILTASVPQKLIDTHCNGKGRHFLPKALASKRKELHSVSPVDDIVEAGSKSNDFDVIVISDDSGYGNFVEISDTSSSNPNRKKRRMNLLDKEFHSNRSVHQYQASLSASNLLPAQNHHHESVEVTKYSEEQAHSRILPDTLSPLESSQDPPHNDGGPLRISETKEPDFSDNLHLETVMMSLGDSAAGDEPHEMCQKVAEVKNWMSAAYKGANISLINSRNSNQKTVNHSCGGAFPIRKLEPCLSVQQDVNAVLLCIEAPNDNKMEIKSEQSVMPPKEEAAFTNGKLEPSSSGQHDVNLLCIEAPIDNNINTASFPTTSSLLLPPSQVVVPERLEKMEIQIERTGIYPKEDAALPVGALEPPLIQKMEIQIERTGIYPKEDAALPVGALEPPLTGQQDVKADLLCIQAPNEMEIKNERVGMSLDAAEGFHLQTCMSLAEMIANESHPQCNVSSQNSLGQLQVSISGKSPGPSSSVHPGMMVDLSTFMPLPVPSSSNLAPAFSTSSVLLMPVHKKEIFERLPQNPHFREVWNCAPEFREGKALGLMISFANMTESIKNMRVQDEAQLYQEKMCSLLDLEENGFEVGPLKLRLNNLLRTRNRHVSLKNKKASLEKEILETEAANCGLEQQLKFLDMLIMGVEEQKYQEMKASVAMKKVANHSSISKLQVDLRQVEESLAAVEGDFCSIAAAPWKADVASSIP